MVIDVDKRYILTYYKAIKMGGKARDSDHATEYLDLDLRFGKERPQRHELWNFKNKEAQQKFKTLTSETEDFSNCFENNLPVLKQIENWRNIFEMHCKKAFKKVRITNKKYQKPFPAEITKIINLRNDLVKIDDIKNADDIEALNQEISDKEAEINRNKIFKLFESYSEDPANINTPEMWKTMNKIWPKFGSTKPTARKNHHGRIVSAPHELKSLLGKEYKERLRTRPIRPDLQGLEVRRKEIFQIKLKLAESNPSILWKMSDLEDALSDLKNNKSRDHEGLINELFKKQVIGDNLKKSLLLMFNKLKTEKIIPLFMNYANVTTVHKKGSRLLLENERGLFRTSVLRSILMRLIYNEKYPTIDSNMSDCQMGARKRKGCRNNLFIVNGIIHDVLPSKKKNPVTIRLSADV